MFKKRFSFKESKAFEGFTDCHSHILPGVDDGVRTMEESLQILDDYAAAGVRRVWLTPHIMEDIPNTTASLRSRFEELSAAYSGPVELCLSAENMIDNLFNERLWQNDLLPIGENRDHLLVETSYFSAPYDLYGTLEQVKKKGYHPVLAHPERYVYMSVKDYDKLINLGGRFQLNYFSLAGLYGKTAKKKGEYLLAKGWIEYMGSDIHSHRVLSLPVSPSVWSVVKSCPSPEF